VLLVRERLEREKAERLALEAAKLAAGDDDDEDGIEELEAA
jgi:hypothetical protein